MVLMRGGQRKQHRLQENVNRKEERMMNLWRKSSLKWNATLSIADVCTAVSLTSIDLVSGVISQEVFYYFIFMYVLFKILWMINLKLSSVCKINKINKVNQYFLNIKWLIGKWSLVTNTGMRLWSQILYCLISPLSLSAANLNKAPNSRQTVEHLAAEEPDISLKTELKGE